MASVCSWGEGGKEFETEPSSKIVPRIRTDRVPRIPTESRNKTRTNWLPYQALGSQTTICSGSHTGLPAHRAKIDLLKQKWLRKGLRRQTWQGFRSQKVKITLWCEAKSRLQSLSLYAVKDLIMVKPDTCFSLQLLEQYTIKIKSDSFSKSQEDNYWAVIQSCAVHFIQMMGDWPNYAYRTTLGSIIYMWSNKQQVHRITFVQFIAK